MQDMEKWMSKDDEECQNIYTRRGITDLFVLCEVYDNIWKRSKKLPIAAESPTTAALFLFYLTSLQEVGPSMWT